MTNFVSSLLTEEYRQRNYAYPTHAIDKRHVDELSWEEFVLRYLCGNRPVIIQGLVRTWPAREWTVDYIHEHFGDVCAPVVNCSQADFPCKDQTVASFIESWRGRCRCSSPSEENGGGAAPVLYLKDWHFVRDFPAYTAYEVPRYFAEDWLNLHWDSLGDGKKDDYRFVYLGMQHSVTPLHADVFRSYSWSANVWGRKLWRMYSPDTETMLKDAFGNYVPDVWSQDIDSKRFPNFKSAAYIEFYQEAGETIFVPSGWHHQVKNVEDTLSINHNWINGCAVDFMWNLLKADLNRIREMILDCKGSDAMEWEQQCQKVLRANTGMDQIEFLQFTVKMTQRSMQLIRKVDSNVEQMFHLVALNRLKMILDELIFEDSFVVLPEGRNELLHLSVHSLREDLRCIIIEYTPNVKVELPV
eukprot:GILK01011265.1.p1 GENE.GILK01011265.1~~GILK01011265.1.p1  ORF type:complete len:424 (-),score=68.50 GILK01011265.1:335-1576(-)